MIATRITYVTVALQVQQQKQVLDWNAVFVEVMEIAPVIVTMEYLKNAKPVMMFVCMELEVSTTFKKQLQPTWLDT